jgi:hypothetical protein
MLMQFTPEQRDLIYAGKKTVHRIPAESGARYREGRTYRVRVSGEDRPLQITVIAPVLEQELGDIEPRDAIREGAKHLREFLQGFAELYGDASPTRKVSVIGFAPGDLRDVPRYLASGGPVPICKAIDRSDGKVCNRGFAVGQERCKCGAKRPPDSADDHGYTTTRWRAIEGAEAVPAEFQERLTTQAHLNRELGRSRRREEMLSAIAEMRRTASDAVERKRLRSVEHHLRALDAEALGVAS